MDELIQQLPAYPKNLFSGITGLFKTPPKEILIFHKENKKDFSVPRSNQLHHRFVINICFKGAADLIIEDRLFSIHPQSGMIVFPHQPHHFAVVDSKELSWLFITFELEDEIQMEVLNNSLFTLDKTLKKYIRKISKCYLEYLKDEENGKDISCWLILLLGYLIHNEKNNSFDQPSIIPSLSLDQERISKLAGFIYQNLHRPFTVYELAQLVHCSESHLRKMFRKNMNISLGNYIRQTRIQKATQLLSSSTMNISQIAEAIGYDSLYTFSRAFKNSTGMSPKNYKQKKQQ